MTRTTRATQVLALLLVALTMGLEFAHTLELGPKLNYPPELYLRLNTSLYAWFGPPLGAAIWCGAILATGVATWLLRRRPGWLLTGAACALQVAALASYFARVEPVNGRFRALAPGHVPADFTALRTQWEHGHALGFALFALAFLLLIIAHPSATAVNSTAPTFPPRGGMFVPSSSRRRPPDSQTVVHGAVR